MRFGLKDVERDTPIYFKDKKKPKKKPISRPHDPDEVPFRHRDFTQSAEYFNEKE
jgi:hypothetical protein